MALSSWDALTVTWTGWDNSVWTLSDPAGGVFLTRGGLRGLSFPPFERFTSKSPLIAGSRYRGGRTDEREVFWPLLLAADNGSDEFIARNRAFRRTLDPERQGVWRVTQPNGETRWVRLRHVPDDVTYDHDPVAFGWQPYGVRLVAEQPFWSGGSISRQWRTEAATASLLAGPGVVNIGPGSTMDTASIPNPGDVEAWPQWIITGPATSVIVGVDGKLLEIPVTLGLYEYRFIDTRPDQLLMTNSLAFPGYEPEDLTYQLAQAEFGAVPPGASVPLTVQVVGGVAGQTTVAATITPQYYEAF